MNRGERSADAALNNHLPIKHWPEGERPREKLVREGPGAVSEAELVAIVLRAGKRGATALDLARALLSQTGSLRNLARLTFHDFMEMKLGEVRAATLSAAFELARRIPVRDISGKPFLRSPEDVVQCVAPKLKDLRHEEFWVLLLSASNQLMHQIRVTKGTLNSSLVHPRECFADALKMRCAGVIFVHNHPSGNPEPSQEDRAITRQLVEAGKILGIPVHDHVIVADAEFTSFAERGLL
jgi:DNA repair protein RadC